MSVYGYPRQIVDPRHGLMELREVSFDLSPMELRAVAEFLVECADRLEGANPRSHYHMPQPPAGIDLVVTSPRRSAEDGTAQNQLDK